MTIEIVVILIVLIGVIGYVSYVSGGWRMNQESCRLISQTAQNEREEWVRILNDIRASHIKIEADLRQQVQSLAQQLATLRVHEGAVPDQERFEPSSEKPKPYSQQLVGFLNAIEYEEARVLVEEDIERLRDEGHDDSQIYTMISEGGLTG